MAGTLNACIAGFTILCFVLGLLISQPEIPLHVNVMFPKLSGESAYSLMALMGANIIAHNFYVHSSIVQVCSGVSNLAHIELTFFIYLDLHLEVH
jgi:ethylene-insensitive protein 2